MRLIQEFSTEFSKLDQDVKTIFFSTVFFFSACFSFYAFCYIVAFFGGN